MSDLLVDSEFSARFDVSVLDSFLVQTRQRGCMWYT